jgi:DNA-binding SARP family transcriptional activator
VKGRGDEEIAAGEMVWLDLAEFDRLAAIGRGEDALDLYAGDLLPGFFLPNAPQFERWLDDERTRLRSTAVSLASQLAEKAEKRRAPAEALRWARRAVVLQPADEAMARELIALLDRCGDQAGALRAYEALRRRLESDYEISPAPKTESVVSRLRARRSTAGLPTTREADVAYERGNYLFLRAAHSGNQDDLSQCRAFFEEAISRAPDFGAAYAGLSNYFAVVAVRGDFRLFHETFARIIELSRLALVHDADLAIPHVHFGVKAMYLDCDWDLAGREFALARDLEPTYTETHKFNGIYFGAMGRWPEAMTALREAVRLEPQIPLYRNALAHALMSVSRTDDAVIELQRALELDGSYSAARERLVRCYEKLGRYADAIAERRRNPKDATSALFERAFADDGADGYRRERQGELRILVDQLAARREAVVGRTGSDAMNPIEVPLAVACAELGDADGAMTWIERGCEANAGRFPWFACRHELEFLREDPRWAASLNCFAALTNR